MATPNHLVYAASILAPKLLRRASNSERNERLPASTVEWLRQQRIARVLDWNARSTVEERLVALADAVRIMSSTCPSTGWIAALYALHFWLIRRFGPVVCRTVLSEAESPLIAAAFQPRGSALQCDEGYIVSGKWEWVSGICHADYVLLNAVVEDTGVRCFFLLRSGDIDIIAGKDLSGLRGTGSHVVVANRVFVPGPLRLEEEVLRGSNAPGEFVNVDPLLRCPLQPVLAMIGSSIAVGAAEGIIRWLVKSLARGKDRTANPFGGRVHLRVGDAAVHAKEARVLWAHAMQDLVNYSASDCTDRSGAPVQFRMAASEIVHHSWNAANVALEMLGAKGDLAWEVIERAHRDLRALRAHYVYRRDESAEALGKMLLDRQLGYV